MEFSKVKIQDDDPATEKVDESRYRIDQHQKDRNITPLAAFTYYLKPIDIQAPVRWTDRFWPNPTIGFGITNPKDDILLGASFELLRNAQIVVGRQWGVQKEQVDRNEVSEDADGSSPATRDRREVHWSIGLTFNLAVISQIFK